ncbi:MAG: hypothetical protein UX62_C0007G0007 [Microgenomates group bacterium GW2011_GWA2_46_7]|nr:MAG: hypothetical protein UX64_C0017G0001 [Microgenomates group bacterium GW2011_GWC2_46_7]KKU46810.1 MAG: hypothetical protein UX62_C0007G0007 [Microgenomates group bacterium GW2011_GWA2_46_7]
MSGTKIRSTPKAFIWDKANDNKNWLKHKVKPDEAEETFFDKNRQEYPDPTHSTIESRSILVGMTKKQRLLFIVYTERDKKIRIISARDINNRRERRLYEKSS